MNDKNTADSIKCPVCLTPFDADKHIPKISPACGHTVCKECLIQVLKMDTPKCPLDKLKFGREFRTIDNFPTNFLGKDLLEMEGKWSICETHQEQMKMICLNDNTLVCGNCVVFGDHKGHNVKKLSTFEEAVNQKRAEISAIGERMSKISSEFTNALDEKKENIKKTIKDRFDSLRSEITKHEMTMLMEVESLFKDEKTKLSTMISATLELPFDIEAKLKEFYNVMCTPNIVKLVEEDFSGVEKILEEKLAPFRRKHTDEISEILAVFQNGLPRENLLKDLSIIEPFNQELAKLIDKRCAEQVVETKEISLLPVKLEINQVQEDDSWKLEVTDSKSKGSWTFLKKDLERISEIHYTFKLTKNIINETDLSMIKLLSKSLKNVKTVRLSIKNESADSVFESLSEAPFFHLISAIFSQLNDDIEHIKLEIKNAPIKDLGLINFAETVLSRSKNLRGFSCTLYNTQTTNKTLRALNQVNFSKYSNLQNFALKFFGCIQEGEEDIIELLNKVPSVSSFSIGLNSPFTDKVLDLLSTKILPSFDKLENFEALLFAADINDEGVQKFLNSIPNVKSLDLHFSRTKITDTAVKDFITNKLTTLTNLKDFTMNLKDTQVSKDILGQVCEWEKKINPEKNSNQDDNEEEGDDEEQEEEEEDEEQEEEDDEEEIDEDDY